MIDRTAIALRQDAVEELIGDANARSEVRNELKKTYDLTRLLARIATARTGPRSPAGSFHSYKSAELKQYLKDRSSSRLNSIESNLHLCPDLRDRLEQALSDDCPVLHRMAISFEPVLIQNLISYENWLKAERSGLPPTNGSKWMRQEFKI